jgi:hypothetical protein
MPPKQLEDFKTLQELLHEEQMALEENDAQKLNALSPQIETYARRISELSSGFSELSPEELRIAKDYVIELKKQVQSSCASWDLYHSQLEKDRRQLQSSRRFVHETRLKSGNRGSRIHHSA